MHIKRVVISGFKSYRDRAIVDDLSSHHNCIEGRNGSGKSNLMEAIRFVLGDRHANLRTEERKALLHDGPGDKVVQASVEIVFDNSDNRLQIDNDEVSLKRVIGLKKDQYFMNHSSINKTDVTRMLELAGFSRSNPYYIVEQGKVASLATGMTDAGRLALLKEVAGTGVYESRRVETKKLVEESEAKCQKADEVLEYMNERQTELAEERTELEQHQKYTKQKRAIEFALFERERKIACDELAQIEAQRAVLNAQLEGQQGEMAELLQRTQESEAAVRVAEAELEDLEAEKRTLQTELPALSSAATKIDVEIQRIRDRQSAAEEEEQHLSEELTRVEEQIGVTTAELDRQTTIFDEASQRLVELTSELNTVIAQQDALYEKQGRDKQFRTKKERDTFLRAQIKQAKNELSAKQGAAEETATLIRQADAKLGTTLEVVRAEKAKIEDAKATCDEAVGNIESLTAELKTASIERQQLWRRASELEKKETALTQQNRDLQSRLDRLCPSHARQGWAALDALKTRRDAPGWTNGIIGPVWQLINPKRSSCNIAVEVIANTQLFNVVVADDGVARACVKYLNDQRAGRITFMPLNRLQVKAIKYPTLPGSVPLINEISYDPAHKAAVQQIFGKTLLCESLEIAQRAAKEGSFNAIDVDGSQASRKGELRGGFIDRHAAYFSTKSKLRKVVDERKSVADELEKQRRLVTTKNSNITFLEGQLKNEQTTRRQARDSLPDHTYAIKRNEKSIESIKRSIASHKDAHNRGREVIAGLEARLATLQTELSTDMTSALSSAEEDELRLLTERREALQGQIKDHSTELEAVRRQKTKLEKRLSSNFTKRRNEIKSRLSMGAAASVSGAAAGAGAGAGSTSAGPQGWDAVTAQDEKLEELQTRYSQAKQAETDAIKQLEEAEETMKPKKEACLELQEAYEANRTRSNKARKTREALSNEVESLLDQRVLARSKRDNFTQRIRDLGTIPAEAEEYHKKSRKELTKRLKKVEDKLTKFGNVNQKALSQFNLFSESREELLKRREELQEGHEAIERVMKVLDERKDQAILVTFKDVAKHFSEVFTELTGDGKGTLVMLQKDAEDEEDEEVDGSPKKKSRKKKKATKKKGTPVDEETGVSQFSGVAVRVSFKGTSGATKYMRQLSGGQRTLVALALIFAIQRTDPAPFYLFDEIDAALDPIYRRAVAQLIHKRTATPDGVPTQYITSTFSAELAKVADKHFGVTMQHKRSGVVPYTKQQALDFIAAKEAEDAERAHDAEDEPEEPEAVFADE